MDVWWLRGIGRAQLATIDRTGSKFFRSAGLDVDILLSETLPSADSDDIALLQNPVVAEGRLLACFVILRTLAAHIDGEDSAQLSMVSHALQKIAFTSIHRPPTQSTVAAVFDGQATAPPVDIDADDGGVSEEYKVRVE